MENLQEQLDAFIADELLQPGVVPRPAIITEAGRSDLVRGVERWGGYKEVANLLGYEVSQAVHLLSHHHVDVLHGLHSLALHD